MKNGTDKGQQSVVPSLLRWFCPDHLIEEIEGDLLHKYQRTIMAALAKPAETLKYE